MMRIQSGRTASTGELAQGGLHRNGTGFTSPFAHAARDETNFDPLYLGLEGQPSTFPCADCGLLTGNYCDGGYSWEPSFDQCYACDRNPHDFPPSEYNGEQGILRTPLCPYCETFNNKCHHCRGVSLCTPHKYTGQEFHYEKADRSHQQKETLLYVRYSSQGPALV